MSFLSALVLCLAAQPAALAATQEPVPQKAIDAAIERGIDFLVSEQELDGSWRFECERHGGGATGLCVYTLVKGGAEKNHQAVLRGLGYLDSLTPTSTYEVACMISAYGSVDPVRYRERLQGLVDLLVDWNMGAWAYPDGEQDLSNTHFGALGLRHAQHAGIEVPEDVWKAVGKILGRWQESYGGFPYRPGGTATLSMTAAGVGIACMVREGLEKAGGGNRGVGQSMETVISRGLRWLSENQAVPQADWGGNKGGPSWDYYYLYALQRVGALAPTKLIGDLDWYQGGARWLLEKQAGDGSWSTIYGAKQSNTCFAILFLRRASAPISGQAASNHRSVRIEDPEADVQFIATGQDPVHVWILALHPLTYDSWAWPEDQDRGLRIQKVEYLLEDRVLATVQGDPSQPVKDARFGAELHFDEPGTYAIRAKVYLHPPPGDDPADAILLSPPLEVPIDIGLQPWMKQYIADCSANLVPGAHPTGEASSAFDDGWGPGNTVDNKQGRGWLCKADDADPWIVLDFKKTLSADTILLSHARKALDRSDDVGKARRVEITINKRKPFVAEMVMQDQRKTTIPLPKTERIRRLKIRLLDREAGTDTGMAAGFAEIELQNR